MNQKRTSPPRRLMKTTEACEYLSISRYTLNRLVHSGDLPVVQIGDGCKWLLDLKDLEAFVGRYKTTAPM